MKAIWTWARGAEAVDDQHPGGKKPDVYPVHTLDRMAEYQKFVATVMYFNDVLDADMLYAALVKLLEIGDWKKLGGRLKKNANGCLELHVPPRFSAAHPAVAYTHENLTSMKIRDHPVARSLPTRTRIASVQPLPERSALRTLQVRPDFPTSLDDLMAEDLPPLSLHIHTFQDATVVGFSWPHLLMDGVARAALMKSWSLVMAGQDEKVPPVTGARHDVLSLLPEGATDQDEFFMKKGLVRGVRLAKVILSWGWVRIAGPRKVSRSIYLPKETYEMLVGSIKDEASQLQGEAPLKRNISESDAITAWITRHIALSEPRPRPVTIMSLFNARYALKRHLEPDAVYLQNMILINYTNLSKNEARGDVAPLAIACKAQLSEQTTESRALGFIHWISKRIDKAKQAIPICMKEGSILLCCNSLIRADLIRESCFSPAVLCAGEAAETRHNPPGSMVNFFYSLPNEGLGFVDEFKILGKDHSGGTWFAGDLSPQVWEALEHELKQTRERVTNSH